MPSFAYRPLLVRAVFATGLAALSFAARAAAPNVCSLVSAEEVGAAVGNAAGGGLLVSTDPGTGTRSCPFQAGNLTIVVAVRPFASSEVAHKLYAADLRTLSEHDGENQRTTVERGLGDGAYSVMTHAGVDSSGWTALKGSQQVMIVVVGTGAFNVPHDRLKALLAKAVSRA